MEKNKNIPKTPVTNTPESVRGHLAAAANLAAQQTVEFTSEVAKGAVDNTKRVAKGVSDTVKANLDTASSKFIYAKEATGEFIELKKSTLRHVGGVVLALLFVGGVYYGDYILLKDLNNDLYPAPQENNEPTQPKHEVDTCDLSLKSVNQENIDQNWKNGGFEPLKTAVTQEELKKAHDDYLNQVIFANTASLVGYSQMLVDQTNELATKGMKLDNDAQFRFNEAVAALKKVGENPNSLINESNCTINPEALTLKTFILGFARQSEFSPEDVPTDGSARNTGLMINGEYTVLELPATKNDGMRVTYYWKDSKGQEWKIKLALRADCANPDIISVVKVVEDKDVCSNISGKQSKVPSGLFEKNGKCYEDACTNIKGNQKEVPDGYYEKDGKCLEEKNGKQSSANTVVSGSAANTGLGQFEGNNVPKCKDGEELNSKKDACVPKPIKCGNGEILNNGKCVALPNEGGAGLN